MLYSFKTLSSSLASILPHYDDLLLEAKISTLIAISEKAVDITADKRIDTWISSLGQLPHLIRAYSSVG